MVHWFLVCIDEYVPATVLGRRQKNVEDALDRCHKLWGDPRQLELKLQPFVPNMEKNDSDFQS